MAKLVPITAYVPEGTRRRVKILAAQMDTTMRKIQDDAFNTGLDFLEQAYRDSEQGQEDAAATEAAEPMAQAV